MTCIKWYAKYLWDCAYLDAKRAFLSLLELKTDACLLDLGSDIGDFTMEIAERIGTRKVLGIDCVEERLEKAKEKGIHILKSDLNKVFPLESETVDVITANQVIEHLYDIDNFSTEIFRVLKPGGYAIVSTENLASWHNIFSLVFGYQPFSLTNISKRNIGNPLALHHGEEPTVPISFGHIKIFAYEALIELFKLSGFTIEKVVGSGYYPLPRGVGQFISRFDPRHAAFLTVKVRK